MPDMWGAERGEGGSRLVSDSPGALIGNPTPKDRNEEGERHDPADWR